MSLRRFTIHGSPEVEEHIARICAELGARCSETLGSLANKTSLILLGGYGRGEGGVRIEADSERPNNNLDCLLIMCDAIDQSHPQIVATSNALRKVGQHYGIVVDVGYATPKRIRGSANLLMWHDCYHGHRVLHGPDNAFTKLGSFPIEGVASLDMTNLMVNRGTLLLINRLLPKATYDEALLRLQWRHITKAIIGYGDALLYSRGEYHWSYLERRERMSKLADHEFLHWYELAMTARFEARYDMFKSQSPHIVEAEILPVCEQVHREVEMVRFLWSDFSWSRYAFGYAAAAAHLPHGMRAKAGMLRSIIKPAPSIGSTLRERLGWRALGPSGRLRAAFAWVCYGDRDESYDAIAADVLEIAVSAPQEERTRAFVRGWARWGDPNLCHVLEPWGVSL